VDCPGCFSLSLVAVFNFSLALFVLQPTDEFCYQGGAYIHPLSARRIRTHSGKRPCLGLGLWYLITNITKVRALSTVCAFMLHQFTLLDFKLSPCTEYSKFPLG
jgi:hypothetical protein